MVMIWMVVILMSPLQKMNPVKQLVALPPWALIVVFLEQESVLIVDEKDTGQKNAGGDLEVVVEAEVEIEIEEEAGETDLVLVPTLVIEKEDHVIERRMTTRKRMATKTRRKGQKGENLTRIRRKKKKKRKNLIQDQDQGSAVEVAVKIERRIVPIRLRKINPMRTRTSQKMTAR